MVTLRSAELPVGVGVGAAVGVGVGVGVGVAPVIAVKLTVIARPAVPFPPVALNGVATNV